MALPILDGNQSLTSLSTVISGGSHIPAHTIVSFGSQAITDMASAISGSSVNVLTMPPISVTATVSGGLTDAQLRASPVTIGGSVTASISGTPSVTFGTAVVTGSASILNFPATQTVTFTQIATHGVTIGAGTAQIGSVTASISGTVAVTGNFYQATQPVSISTLPASTVTISSLPALVAGTAQIGSVTASVSNFPATQTVTFTQIATHGVIIGAGTSQIGSVTASISGTVAVSGTFYQATQPVSIASLPALASGTNQIGSVTASITSLPSTTVTVSSLPSLAAGTNQIGSVTASISGTVPVSGTVTANTGLTQPLTDAQLRASAVPVSGTFYPATQPVSIASLPSLAAGTNQVGSVTASLNQGGTAVGSANPLQVTLANTGANATAIKVDGSASIQPISGSVTAFGQSSSGAIYPLLVGEAYTSFQNSTGLGRVAVEPIDQNGNTLVQDTKLKTLVTNSVTASVSGTVTANVLGTNGYADIPLNMADALEGFANGKRLGTAIIDQDGIEYGYVGGVPFVVQGTVTIGNSVTISSLPAISGTVTASVTNSVTVGSLPVQLSTTTIGGTARLNVTLSSAAVLGATVPSYGNLYGGSDGTNLRAISVDTSGRTVVTGSLTVTQSGSTTIGALPSGALTTNFGSVTTANTAQITSAVTNTSRKYLLAQNISSGTVTIGIGFSPTTTKGIQLTAGAGITFDSFCPTGAVWWLGATTGANFTILEG